MAFTLARGANYQAGTGEPPAGLPLLVIVDAGSAPARDGWLYRLMDPGDMTKLAAGSRVQLWNEQDSPTDRAERLAAIAAAYALGLLVVYGGDVVDPATGWSAEPDMTVLAQCDYYGLHATVNSPVPPAVLYGKPVIVTELEKTPRVDSEWSLVPPWMAVCPAPAFFFAWRWRDNAAQQVDLADHPDIAARIVALNQTSGEPTVAVDPSVQQVLDQNAYIAQAQYDIVKMLAAVPNVDPNLLQEAKTMVNALNPAKFTFDGAAPNPQ